MALYAFDGTWNSDEDDAQADTNVVRFKELYLGNNVEYISGVGTRFGKVGAALGGLFGAGGRTRISEMYDELCENWQQGDQVIDIIGFSRGAALAVHFANKIGEEGVKLEDGNTQPANVRFLGVWDIVGSFGLSFDTIINFQDINLGWNIDTVNECAEHCFHAMALDERRETFNVTRLDKNNDCPGIREVWFRGVHSDVGGGSLNETRSNIALQWMLDQGRSCGLKFDEEKALLPRYSKVDRFAPISENQDVKRDPRRKVYPEDEKDPSADGIKLGIGESHQCEVQASIKYNWSGVRLEKDVSYSCRVTEGDTWSDDEIECGPDGWSSNELPWYEEGVLEFAEQIRRKQDAQWFALIGALDDEDDNLILIGNKDAPFVASKDADLYLFANDMPTKYRNNKGSLKVRITRVA
ncbi:MAG: DUF2235 domain-containing protein [Candidatus Thiodiazotropha sp.]